MSGRIHRRVWRANEPTAQQRVFRHRLARLQCGSQTRCTFSCAYCATDASLAIAADATNECAQASVSVVIHRGDATVEGIVMQGSRVQGLHVPQPVGQHQPAAWRPATAPRACTHGTPHALPCPMKVCASCGDSDARRAAFCTDGSLLLCDEDACGQEGLPRPTGARLPAQLERVALRTLLRARPRVQPQSARL